MPVFKCKMCGGDLVIDEGTSVAECEYCGTKQTVPNADNEKKMTLFARANRLRLSNEFDKAAGVYESIVAEFPEEAEAYWGLVLCRYGIEYVDDPATGKKIPTCHRSSFDSVMDDADFEQACENADAIARRVYRDEAKAIEEIRKGILEVSGKEEPYDIFICYKETADDGQRTVDSVIAQDVYDALTEKGYRVFFSRISLEDKLGTEYEPYIFAALNSAKIMLAFGTDYEHYNAVWVKNEWSRFLKLMAADKTKHLIPCYKGIDAYDMPKEFARLQAQDIGKVGAMQDLLRGIEKILGTGNENTSTAAAQSAAQQIVTDGSTVLSLLKRAKICYSDGEWDKANELLERVLDADPECGEAYLYRAAMRLKCKTLDDLRARCINPYDDTVYSHADMKKAFRFSTGEASAMLQQWEQDRNTAIELDIQTRKKNIPLLEQRRAELAKVNGLVADSHVGLRIDGTVVAENDEYNLSEWCDIVSVVDTGFRTVGLKRDGTVVAVGDNRFGQCDVNEWHDIVSIAGYGGCTVGLKRNGTVVATGYNTDGQCNVKRWRKIASVAGYGGYTVGLRRDGTVVAAGNNKYGQRNVNEWCDIASVVCARECTFGLKCDGTVVAVGDNRDGQCNVNEWRDIVSVASNGKEEGYTVGLKRDGTVVAVGGNSYGQCNVNGWRDIVSISCDYYATAGLRLDGTVVFTGLRFNEDNQYNASEWCDIVSIGTDNYGFFGLKSDGTVIGTHNSYAGWKLFNSFETIDQEREEAIRLYEERRIAEEKAAEKRRIAEEKAAEERRIAEEKAAEKRRIAEEKAAEERRIAEEKVAEKRRIAEERRQAEVTRLNAEKSALQTELANLKGLFTGKRRRELELQIYQVDKIIQNTKKPETSEKMNESTDAETQTEIDKETAAHGIKCIFLAICVAFAAIVILIRVYPTYQAKRCLSQQITTYFESAGLSVEKVRFDEDDGYLSLHDYNYHITATMDEDTYKRLKAESNSLADLLYPPNGAFRGKTFYTRDSNANLASLSCGEGRIIINGDVFEYQTEDKRGVRYYRITRNGADFWSSTYTLPNQNSKKTGPCSGGSVGCRQGYHPCHEMRNGYCNQCCHD